MADAGYEYFADDGAIGIRAWAPDRARAFAEMALGVFGRIVELMTVADRERREVRAQGDSPETLLVNWINEGLYVQEIEGFAVHAVEVTLCTVSLVHGFLLGEPFDGQRHRSPGKPSVTAVTLRGARVAEADGRVEARLLVGG